METMAARPRTLRLAFLLLRPVSQASCCRPLCEVIGMQRPAHWLAHNDALTDTWAADWVVSSETMGNLGSQQHPTPESPLSFFHPA